MLILRSQQEAVDPLGSLAHVMPCSVSLPVFLGARRNEDWPSRSHCQCRSDPSVGSEQVNSRRRESAPPLLIGCARAVPTGSRIHADAVFIRYTNAAQGAHLAPGLGSGGDKGAALRVGQVEAAAFAI